MTRNENEERERERERESHMPKFVEICEMREKGD